MDLLVHLCYLRNVANQHVVGHFIILGHRFYAESTPAGGIDMQVLTPYGYLCKIRSAVGQG